MGVHVADTLPRVWLVWAGRCADCMTVVAASGTETEAQVLLADVLAGEPGAANLVEDRPAPSPVSVGERREIYVLVVAEDGEHDADIEVFDSRTSAESALADVTASGRAHLADLVTLRTNTPWRPLPEGGLLDR